jgi:hypothetical protein
LPAGVFPLDNLEILLNKIKMIMKRRRFDWIKVACFALVAAAFTACQDDAGPRGKGEVEIEITDAPSDDANIKSVMVTVAEVKVNGQAISGFSKQTIDLKAYQEGSTKLLGSAQLDARSDNKISLVLDLDSDANGNAPGCYVLTQDNSKFKLKSTATGQHEVTANQSWKIAADAKTKIVLDFDLRKSLKYNDDQTARYTFVSDNNLNAAVRVIARENAGSIKGSYEDDTNTDADQIVVYAYKKGTFNASNETVAQGEDGIMFKNAVASAEVKGSLTGRTYTLAFLEEGEYELHFIAFNKNADNGRLTYASRLQSETSVNGSVANTITVKAGISLNISSAIKGTF